jgi:hypothetical protein
MAVVFYCPDSLRQIAYVVWVAISRRLRSRARIDPSENGIRVRETRPNKVARGLVEFSGEFHAASLGKSGVPVDIDSRLTATLVLDILLLQHLHRPSVLNTW